MREHNQTDFKRKLIIRYQCSHNTNVNITKCMLLNHYFSTEQVVAAHIIGLKSLGALQLLGLNPVDDKYSDKNGILIHKAIEALYGSQEVVCIKFYEYIYYIIVV